MTLRGAADANLMLLAGVDVLGVTLGLKERREARIHETTPAGAVAPTWGWSGLRDWRLEQSALYDDATGALYDVITGSANRFGGRQGNATFTSSVIGNPISLSPAATSSGPGGSRMLCYSLAGGAAGAEFDGGMAAVRLLERRPVGGGLTKLELLYSAGSRVPNAAEGGGTTGTTGRQGGALLDGLVLLALGVQSYDPNSTVQVESTAVDSGRTSTAGGRFFFAITSTTGVSCSTANSLKFFDSSNGTTWRGPLALARFRPVNNAAGRPFCGMVDIAGDLQRYWRCTLGADATNQAPGIVSMNVFAGFARY